MLLTLAFLFLLLAVALLAYAELSLPTELPIMKFIIQSNPRFSGAFLLTAPSTCSTHKGQPLPSFNIPCANNATAHTLRRELTSPASQAVDTPPVNFNRQTASITANLSGNYTVTVRNLDGSIADRYDCRNWSTAQYLTRNFR
jgi:hypothetical protein